MHLRRFLSDIMLLLIWHVLHRMAVRLHKLPVKYDKYGLTSPVLLLMYVCQDLQILLLPGR